MTDTATPITFSLGDCTVIKSHPIALAEATPQVSEQILIGVEDPDGTIRPVGCLVPGSTVYDSDTHTVTFAVRDPDFPDWLFENPTKET